MIRSPTVSRRTFLASTAVLAAGASGCLGGDDDLPRPVALDAGQSCDFCGMIIRDHPGPSGQTYYAENSPEGREDEPAWFCSNQCLFDFYYERSELGWEPVVHYVNDYSSLDYEVREEGSSLFISSHLTADSFVQGEGATLVIGSDAQGAMGPSLIPFTDSEDATEFQEEYGGEVLGFGDVTRGVLDSL